MANPRKNLLVTIDPGQGTTPLIIDYVAQPLSLGSPAHGIAFVGRGGTPGYTFAIIAGALPTGLSIDALTGAVTGTPSAQGHFEFTAQITDAASNVFASQFAINVGSGLFPSAYQPTMAVKSVPYRYQVLFVDSTGSSAGITYAVTQGALPSSLSLSSAGVISGTTTDTAATYYFTVTGTKSGATLDMPMIIVLRNKLSIGNIVLPPALKNIAVGVPVDDFISLDGAGNVLGIPPYTWSITAGSLPAGLSMNSRGRITGTPTAATPTSYMQPTFQVMDKTLSTLTITPTSSTGLSVNSTLRASANQGRIFASDDNGMPIDIDYFAQYFGDASDGSVTLDGTANPDPTNYPLGGLSYVAHRDLYFNDLTLTSTAKLNLNGFKLFVAGTLDLTNAGAGAINSNGIDGSSLGGAGVLGTDGGAGGTGAANNGNAGSASADIAAADGGRGGPGSSSVPSGGNGTLGRTGGGIGLGGLIKAVLQRALNQQDITWKTVSAGVFSAMQVGGGSGGGGGGGGAGNGTDAGGNGGHGGGGGGVVSIAARKIIRALSTAASAIQAVGGKGQNGSNSSNANCGGGGAGSGGGGGKIRIVVLELLGTPKASALDASGADGGTGGLKTGTGTNGLGGYGGQGGSILLQVISTATQTLTKGSTVNAPSGTTAGLGDSCLAAL